MLYYRRFGFVLPQTETLGSALSIAFEIIDCESTDSVPLRFLFEDVPGGTGCSSILEHFPQFASFAIRTRQADGTAAIRLSNLDRRWQGGSPEVSGEPSRETLLEASNGIPMNFPLWIASIILGPIHWNGGVSELTLREASAGRASLNKPPFSGLAPSMTYLSPGTILQRLSAGGLRLWVTFQFLDSAETQPLPAIRKFIDRFGPPHTDMPMCVSEEQEIAVAPREEPDPARIHAEYKSRMAEIVAGLSLPFKPPGPAEFGQIIHKPLGKVRPVIVETFSRYGWKRAPERMPAGSHKLVKQTPGGRRMELSFDTGSWSRHVVCILSLFSERGSARIIIPADVSSSYQYTTPNPQIFVAVLENMQIVVAHLESTWLLEMEAAMDPVNI